MHINNPKFKQIYKSSTYIYLKRESEMNPQALQISTRRKQQYFRDGIWPTLLFQLSFIY